MQCEAHPIGARAAALRDLAARHGDRPALDRLHPDEYREAYARHRARGAAASSPQQPWAIATRELRRAHPDEFDALHARHRAEGATWDQARAWATSELMRRHAVEYRHLHDRAKSRLGYEDVPPERLSDRTLYRAQQRLTRKLQARTLSDARLVAERRRRVIARLEAGDVSRETAMRMLGVSESMLRKLRRAYRESRLWDLQPVVHPGQNGGGARRTPESVAAVVRSLGERGVSSRKIVAALAAEGRTIDRRVVLRLMREAA